MKLLRIKQVLEIIPISKSTLWAWVKDGRFPEPVRLSARCTVWRAEDVQSFAENITR